MQILDKTQNFLILHNGYDQELIIFRLCLILNRINIYYFLNNCIQKNRIISENKLQICNMVTLVTLLNNTKLILILNQFLINECFK